MKKIFIFISLWLGSWGLIPAKQYGLDKARIFYSLHSDGTIRVMSELTYWFSGSFSEAWITIPQTGLEIVNPAVSELRGDQEFPYQYSQNKFTSQPFTFIFTQEAGEYRLTWFYRATDTRKTFRLYYEIIRGLKIYEDIAEFYFKVWGEEWEVGLPALWVEIIFPTKINSPTEVNYWLHPQVEGEIGLSQNFDRIVAYAENLPPKQWVEIRVLLPRAYFPHLDSAKVKTVAGQGKEKILKQEQAWQVKQIRREKILVSIANLSLPLAVIISVFGLFLVLRIYFLYGREPKINYEAEYEREIPEAISPAQADMVFNQSRQVSSQALVASTLELARQGFLQIVEVEEKGFFGQKIRDYQILLTGKKETKDLSEDLLFFLKKWTELAERKEGILISELKEKNLAPFKRQFDKKVREIVYEKKGWLNYQGEKILNWWGTIFFMLAFVIFLGFFLSDILPSKAIALSLPGSLLFNFALSLLFRKAVRQYTPEGRLLALRLKALKRFLQDFSLMAQYPPASLIVWEKYLVFGTVLGVAKEVIRAMKALKIPWESIPWFVPTSPIRISDPSSALENFHSSLQSFSQSFSAAVAPASRSHSSPGGGGGAGGGGGGAR